MNASMSRTSTDHGLSRSAAKASSKSGVVTRPGKALFKSSDVWEAVEAIVTRK